MIFALAPVVFLLLLIFFRTPFGPYPLISWQDALDHLTPLVLIPLYWLLFTRSGSERASALEESAFMVLAALWTMGQGMHLSANSVNNLSEKLAKQGGLSILSTDIYRLTYFYDERLSHYVWHIALLGLIALLVLREWRRPAGAGTVWPLAAVAGLLYGFLYSCVFLEGQTVALGLPFAAGFTLAVLLWARGRLSRQPVLAFFTVSIVLALVLFGGWGLYWGGVPQFTDVGLI